MRKVLFAAALIGGIGVTGSAIAATGQCFDRFGRPVDPAFPGGRREHGGCR